MIIRPINREKFEAFYRELRRYAHKEPLEAFYTVRMTVDNAEYLIKLMPARGCSIAVLQACCTYLPLEEPANKLITDGELLYAFLAILLYQGIPHS